MRGTVDIPLTGVDSSETGACRSSRKTGERAVHFRTASPLEYL